MFCFVLFLRQSLCVAQTGLEILVFLTLPCTWVTNSPCLMIEGLEARTYVFSKIVLAFLGLLFYRVIFAKQLVLIEIVLTVDERSLCILTILNPAVHKHKMFKHPVN